MSWVRFIPSHASLEHSGVASAVARRREWRACACTAETGHEMGFQARKYWLRGGDLNPRPLGYEPNELPDCSTPRHVVSGTDRTATYLRPERQRRERSTVSRAATHVQGRPAKAIGLLQRRRQLVVILRNLLRSLQRHPQSILLALGRGHLGDEGRRVRWTASELHTIDAHQ